MMTDPEEADEMTEVTGLLAGKAAVSLQPSAFSRQENGRAKDKGVLLDLVR
jgi:hypothetical protein